VEYSIKIDDIYLSNTFMRPITDLSLPYTQFSRAVEHMGMFLPNLFIEQNMAMSPSKAFSLVETHEH
jgi:hypothetical protein